jgi:hypothetical protein
MQFPVLTNGEMARIFTKGKDGFQLLPKRGAEQIGQIFFQFVMPPVEPIIPSESDNQLLDYHIGFFNNGIKPSLEIPHGTSQAENIKNN